jgi:hypothetical protein
MAVGFLVCCGLAVAAASRVSRPSADERRSEGLETAIADAAAANGVPTTSVSCTDVSVARWSCSLVVSGGLVEVQAVVDAGGQWRTGAFADPAGDPASEFSSGRAFAGCCLEPAPSK